MSQFAIQEFFDWLWRVVLAQTVTILFLLLNIVSLSLPHAGDLKPFFVLIAVYFWSINRPTVMPILYTFCLGLLLDVLSDLPLGVSALILVLIQTIVQRSRLFLLGQPFVAVWIGFMIVSFLYALLFWVLLTVSNLTIFPKETLIEVMIAGFLTTLMFPAFSWLLHIIHKLLPTTYNPLRGAS